MPSEKRSVVVLRVKEAEPELLRVSDPVSCPPMRSEELRSPLMA